jgi:hypothetical protein
VGSGFWKWRYQRDVCNYFTDRKQCDAVSEILLPVYLGAQFWKSSLAGAAAARAARNAGQVVAVLTCLKPAARSSRATSSA